jgi:rhodanese-related sulfurtransferase
MNRTDCQPTEAHEASRTGRALILDVRSLPEWRTGHIQGAHHIPLHELAERLHELPHDRTIVCQCATGGRSAQAARLLASAGYTTCNLDGGIIKWRMNGLPVTAGA